MINSDIFSPVLHMLQVLNEFTTTNELDLQIGQE